MDPRDLGSEIGAADEFGAVKYLDIRRSTLGGADRASLLIKASADAQEHWPQGIFHSSPYAIFHLDADMRLSLVSSGIGMPKFRARKAKSIERAAELIADYMSGML